MEESLSPSEGAITIATNGSREGRQEWLALDPVLATPKHRLRGKTGGTDIELVCVAA